MGAYISTRGAYHGSDVVEAGVHPRSCAVLVGKWQIFVGI